MLAKMASSRLGDPMTKLSPTDLMRAALIIEGQALELEENGYRYRADWSEIEDLRRLATGLRELACSTD